MVVCVSDQICHEGRHGFGRGIDRQGLSWRPLRIDRVVPQERGRRYYLLRKSWAGIVDAKDRVTSLFKDPDVQLVIPRLQEDRTGGLRQCVNVIVVNYEL